MRSYYCAVWNGPSTLTAEAPLLRAENAGGLWNNGAGARFLTICWVVIGRTPNGRSFRSSSFVAVLEVEARTKKDQPGRVDRSAESRVSPSAGLAAVGSRPGFGTWSLHLLARPPATLLDARIHGHDGLTSAGTTEKPGESR